jgi:hypothetical protein
MNTDGNLAALRQHEKEIEEKEKVLEAFNEEVLNYGILDAFEQLESDFNEKAKQYGINDIDFVDWIKENV